ncbi:hypothetical protein QAD02_014772 [Eretmocerus hayati]|uniref:Uncharacterized protein n=1 Tax=Eretmocerus hayati TaxID=131215 RepID=A0ACC2P5X7_9HYME|nr:hypothetical protein QAD02_014772 [Eretmocerus hayati]
MSRGAMEVPRFPAPPALVSRSISLDWNERGEPPPRHRRFDRIEASSGSSISSNRARSASWLVAAARNRRSNSRRGNHVAPKQQQHPLHSSLKLTLTMEERPYCPEINDNHTHFLPPVVEHGVTHNNQQVLPRIGEGRCLKPIRRELHTMEDANVINYATTEQSRPSQMNSNIVNASCASERLPPIHVDSDRPSSSYVIGDLRSQGTQSCDIIRYRLRVFPSLRDVVDDDAKQQDPKHQSSILLKFFRLLMRLALCQFGLVWLLAVWAILGASAFYAAEGPRELEQVVELKDMQRDLAVGLATELRQLKANDEKQLEPLWADKVQQYVARHEKLLLGAINAGYGEAGTSGQLWTFPGCFLFAISILTTLGFGAPVPRTSHGRSTAIVFAAIGIPLHFLLILNLGLMLAVKLRRYGVHKKYGKEIRDPESIDGMPTPMWVKMTPFICMAVYYFIGVMCFGVARRRPVGDSLMYPLDFTAAGGLSRISGPVRIFYGLFLEGAVALAAFAVSVLQVSASQSLNNVGLKYGLLTPA